MTAVPLGRATRPVAASSVAPVASRDDRSLRPCLGTTIAPRRRATFRQPLLAALAAAFLVALPAAAEPPTGGTFTPGRSLAGVELGMTRGEVRETWGSRHGVCRDCAETTWYVNERPFRPQGAGVVFERGRVWQPEEWTTPEGLTLGAPAGDIGATYGELAEIDCGDYLALVDNGPGATSAFYVYDEEVWGFGLLTRGRAPCL
jgi:hypothetical protein